MSDNVEIILNIDTLEIYDVIDLDQEAETLEVTESSQQKEGTTDKPKVQSSKEVLWQIAEGGQWVSLSPRNRFGSYPFTVKSRDGTCGHTIQLCYEEALWKTLEYAPERLALI